MSEDGFAELAARSARVKSENLQLLYGLRAFEQKLLDLVEGLGCGGNSETIAFDEILDQEEEPIGHTACYLAFTGRELKIGWKEVPRPSEYDYWTLCSLEEAGTDMQRGDSGSQIDLLTYLRKIEPRGALTTAEKCRTWLNQLFRYAVVEGGLETNPAADFDSVSVPQLPVSSRRIG